MNNEQRTTTSEAVLGLLSLRPMSGYEIKSLIEESIGNFWSESFGQIYPTLKRLEQGACIRVCPEAKRSSDAGRASRRYELTPAGRERLEAWLAAPVRPQVPRNELLLKLFFGEHAAGDTLLEQVGAARERYSRDLARYEAMTSELQKTRNLHPGFPYWMSTLSYGMTEAQAHLAWAEATLAMLAELPQGPKKNIERNAHAN